MTYYLPHTSIKFEIPFTHLDGNEPKEPVPFQACFCERDFTRVCFQHVDERIG